MSFDGGGGGGLYLATIPIPPGDPGELSAAAGTYTAAHGEIERNRAAAGNFGPVVGSLMCTTTGRVRSSRETALWSTPRVPQFS
jgi:hypothetical protein